MKKTSEWIKVEDRLPECDMRPNSFGVPILIWPYLKSEGTCEMPMAFYGCRQSDEPNFYIFGKIIDPLYWQPMPARPESE